MRNAFFAFGQFEVLFGQGPILNLDVGINRNGSQLDAFSSALPESRSRAVIDMTGHETSPIEVGAIRLPAVRSVPTAEGLASFLEDLPPVLPIRHAA